MQIMYVGAAAFLGLCARVGPIFGAILGAFYTIYVDIFFRCEFFGLTWLRSSPALSERTKQYTMQYF